MPITVGNSSGMLKRKYNTKLGAQEEKDFQKTYPSDASKDYDMRGWYDQNAQSNPSHSGHYTDQFKKPNHPTFSSESQYSTKDNPGGTWLDNDFMPSDNQINTPAKVKKLKGYWKQAEKGQLLLPKDK